MPPKSAKKELKCMWHSCEKCGVKIHQNKLTAHVNYCGSFSPGILNSKFNNFSISPTLPSDIVDKDAPATYLQRFLFVPEAICSLCDFSMGCNLLIEFGEQKFVRTSWTISSKYADNVFSNSEEFQLESEENPICVSRLSQRVRLIQSIELQLNEKLQDTKDVARLIRARLKDTIVHHSNVICLNFLNKKLKLVIKSISPMPENDMTQMFSQIQLGDDQFYLVDAKTSVKIVNGESNETKDLQTVKTMSLNQIGGLNEVIQDLKRTIDLAVGVTQTTSSMKLSRAVLVHGLTGSGKTTLCHALAESYTTAHKITIDSWKIFSKYYGESESNLKKHFNDAILMYPKPAIIIIDEISNICPKNDSSDSVKRVSALLANLIDNLHVNRNGSKVFVLANTNNLENVDPAIRRSGRLDHEVELSVPNTEKREMILEKMLVNYNFVAAEIVELSKRTHGFVAADLENLITKSIQTVKTEGKFTTTLSFRNLIENLSKVRPSAMRELLIEKPNVKWSDIGGMSDLKLKLKQIVEWPINHPETFERLGIKAPTGLLMFGPPGCSKTMIAKALATETNLNFISIKGSDLFSMWVGESEKAVRDLFVKARQLSPCIVFFDEIDAIGGERSAESGSSVKERVLAQILTEIDGVNALKNVIIIAATNRPDLIDKALMRPGRLDRIVYVELPNAETRAEIFQIKLSKIPISGDVDIKALVSETEGYSGAEIEAVCKEAALKALEHSFEIHEIEMEFFIKALEVVKPRTSQTLLQLYSEYEKRK